MIAPLATRDVNGEQAQFFGWVPPECRTREESAKVANVMASLPAFQLSGTFRGDKVKVGLYEARQKIAKTQHPPTINQSTGSCVGAGGGNALMTLRDVEIAIGGKLAEPDMFWWLYTYGESRELSGMRSRGDGSTGAGWAKAITTKGTFLASEPGLPPFEMRNGWYYLSPSIERQWSDGQMEPGKWDPMAAKHLVKTAAQCRSAEDVATALQNGYPVTIASMFGTTGQQVLGDGDNRVCVSEWNGSWAHQMYVDAWWNHPTLGELFRVGNNWGPDAHKAAVDGSPNGGFWIRKPTMQRICQGQEAFALSAFNGFPARELDWDIL